MRAVVTGATGYLGRYLAAELERQGWQVVRCVRSHASGAEAGTCLLPDLDQRSVAALPLECDAVFHLAGLAHRYPPNAPTPQEFMRVNAEGTGVLARAARGKARALVLVSSVAAVASSSTTPLTPSTPPQPETPYGQSKLRAEALAQEALAGSTTSLRVVRLPAVHGPGAPGAVGQLARWISRGKPVPSCAATVRRSMIGVDNAISALICAATHPALAGRTLMPADGPAPTLLEAAQAIARAQGRTVRVLPVPAAALHLLAGMLRLAPGGGVRGTQAIQRLVQSCAVQDDQLQRLAGWQPPRTADQSIQCTVAAQQAAEVRA